MIEGLLRGRVLGGRYRVEEVIGRGGMGAVYRATDERLGRAVAVKVITVAAGTEPGARDRLRARFLREARSAAALPHHPNVVPVYDYGTDEELGLDYLVMELLRGEDLASLLAQSGAPPLASAIGILHEAATGVAVGHRHGLVHRDVKPGNLFLSRGAHDSDVQVRVLDFGIAKLADDDTASQLTQDGRMPLSPAYASPEQLRGLSQFTPATDVFSLGAVGFQLLTGEKPFTDAERNRLSIGMPVAVPSARARNPAIPEGVDEIVRRALQFDPQDRWPDAITLASVLEQARRELGQVPLAPYAAGRARKAPPADPAAADQDGETQLFDDRTLLDPPLPPAPAAQPPRRELPPRPPREEPRRWGGWVVALLAAAVLIAAGIVVFQSMQPSRPGVADGPEPPSNLPNLTPDITVEQPEQGGDLDAFVINAEGQRFFEDGEYSAALETFRRAVEISPDVPEYRFNFALAMLRLRLDEEAEEQLNRVVRQKPGFAVAHFRLGEVRLSRADTAGAIRAFESVLELSDDPLQKQQTDRRLRELRASQRQPLPTIQIAPPDSPAGVPPAAPDSVPPSHLR